MAIEFEVRCAFCGMPATLRSGIMGDEVRCKTCGTYTPQGGTLHE
jgi:hypothetical protein